ncbi:hypothetical protein [Micromonospora chalcea]|uniref:hypothetical protein n=1 Tax=Micromonospora chalcea TaxID=1874 RepID=UPI003D745BEB
MDRTVSLAEPIEAVNISDDGEALAAMIDFAAGETIHVEQQADPGANGIFGWEGSTIAYYQSRGWSTATETVFRARGHRYLTFNLARLES